VLATGDLGVYDAIWLGIRPYLARPILTKVNHRLLAWVARGGVLIVNYNKTREWDPAYAPYPLSIGNDRVTREDALVEIPDPEARLMNRPNPIRAADFDGWVQERGLYFPEDYDLEKYEVLLRSYDPGRPAIPGLLVAAHGKGTYVYTSFVWYRQLEILNPAALKIMANLVSIPWVE
jgi:hypothetical protein